MADMQKIGPHSGPLGQFLRESVTNRLPGDLKPVRLGVTITAWTPRCQNSPPMFLDARTARIAINGTFLKSLDTSLERIHSARSWGESYAEAMNALPKVLHRNVIPFFGV